MHRFVCEHYFRYLGQLGAKDAILKYMYNYDKKLRSEALSALQKILVYHM